MDDEYICPYAREFCTEPDCTYRNENSKIECMCRCFTCNEEKRGDCAGDI